MDIIKHAVGYVRVSTKDQAIDGYSLDAQRSKIVEYCKNNHLALDRIYSDEGISGSSISKRPGIKELIFDAKQKQFDTVIVWKNSRIARNTRDLLSMVDIFQKHGISFASVSEKIDLDSAQGRFMFTIMGTVSELERNNIAENVYLGMYKRAQDGYASVGKVLGYDPGLDDKGKKILVVNTDESKIIKLIFTKFISGYGFRAVANSLNSNNFKTKLGNAFSTNAVKDIIDNPLYVGLVRYAKYRNWSKKRRNGINSKAVLVKGNHEPIISESTWKKAVLRRKATTVKPAWNNQGANILTGILKCPQCGSSMAASNTTNTLKDGTKKRIRYYSCSQFRNKGSHVCHANSIQAKKAEKMVFDKLHLISISNDLLNMINNGGSYASDLHLYNSRIVAKKQAKIKSNNYQITRYKAISDTDSFLATTLKPRILELENNNYQLKLEIEKLKYSNNAVNLNSTTVTKIKLLIDNVLRLNNPKIIKNIYKLMIDEIRLNNSKNNVFLTVHFNDGVRNLIVHELKKSNSYNNELDFSFNKDVKFTF